LRDEMASMRDQMATKDELNALAITVDNMRDQMATKDELNALAITVDNIRDQMATKDELNPLAIKVENMREQMVTRDDLAALKTQMATKDDFGRFETNIKGDFEQVHLRFDNLERTISTRFGFIETEVSRLRSAVYLLGKDRPEVLRLLGQPNSG